MKKQNVKDLNPFLTEAKEYEIIERNKSLWIKTDIFITFFEKTRPHAKRLKIFQRQLFFKFFC